MTKVKSRSHISQVTQYWMVVSTAHFGRNIPVGPPQHVWHSNVCFLACSFIANSRRVGYVCPACQGNKERQCKGDMKLYKT